MRHLGFAFVFLLASAARPVSASRDTDAVARALPACAELRDAMQGECWTPLAVLNAHGEPLVEGSPLDNRCDALYQAALIVCPNLTIKERLQVLRPDQPSNYFADFDLVVLPTRRRTPRKIDAAIKREESDKPRNPELENTGQFNVYGIPAISVPCGFTASGLPVGLMIAGPRFSEGRVLALANAYERATDWRNRKPPLQPGTPVPPLASTDDDKE